MKMVLCKLFLCITVSIIYVNYCILTVLNVTYFPYLYSICIYSPSIKHSQILCFTLPLTDNGYALLNALHLQR